MKMATFLGTESDNTTDYGNVSGDEDSTSMNSESEERDIDLIVQMMRSKKYAEYLKGLMSEVVESKIGPRLDYCESQIRDMKIKVDKLELKAAERHSGESDLVIEVSRLKSELNDLEQYGRQPRRHFRSHLVMQRLSREASICFNTMMRQVRQSVVMLFFSM